MAYFERYLEKRVLQFYFLPDHSASFATICHYFVASLRTIDLFLSQTSSSFLYIIDAEHIMINEERI